MGRRGWTYLVVVSLSVMGMSMAVDVAPAHALGPEATDYFARTNALRASIGVQQLQVDEELSGLAQAWAEHMASTYTLAHPPDITQGVTSPWLLLGDNMAMGSTIDLAWDGLIHSPVHYHNLSEPRYTHIGIGVAYAADGTQWVEQWFMQLGDESTFAPPADPEPTPQPAPLPSPEPEPAPSVAVLPEVQLLPVNLAVIPPIDYGHASNADEQASVQIDQGEEGGSSLPWAVWLAVPLALVVVVIGAVLALRGRRPTG